MDTSDTIETPSLPTPQSRSQRKLTRKIQVSSRYKAYALMTQVMNVVEPVNYDQAKDHKEWKNAMNEEYESIMKKRYMGINRIA